MPDTSRPRRERGAYAGVTDTEGVYVNLEILNQSSQLMLRDSLVNFSGVKDSDTFVFPGFGGLPNAEPLILNRMSNDFEFF